MEKLIFNCGFFVAGIFLPPEWVVFPLGFAHGWLRAGTVTPAHRQIPKRIGRMACPIMQRIYPKSLSLVTTIVVLSQKPIKMHYFLRSWQVLGLSRKTCYKQK